MGYIRCCSLDFNIGVTARSAGNMPADCAWSWTTKNRICAEKFHSAAASENSHTSIRAKGLSGGIALSICALTSSDNYWEYLPKIVLANFGQSDAEPTTIAFSVYKEIHLVVHLNIQKLFLLIVDIVLGLLNNFTFTAISQDGSFARGWKQFHYGKSSHGPIVEQQGNRPSIIADLI